MVEILLVFTILTLIVLTIRRGKPVVLDNPVIISRPGQYHIMLAPQLNRAHTFIEQIAQTYIRMHPPQGDLPGQYYEIRDTLNFPIAASDSGESDYLLAVTLREGILYFQAISPQPLIYDADSHYKTIRTFSDLIMKQHPHSTPAEQLWAEKLSASISTVAGHLQIEVRALQDNG